MYTQDHLGILKKNPLLKNEGVFKVVYEDSNVSCIGKLKPFDQLRQERLKARVFPHICFRPCSIRVVYNSRRGIGAGDRLIHRDTFA
jgi:hypothetical protein